MHETYIHTVFEPLVKKHLPFFSCFVKKDIHASQREIPSCDKAYEIVFSEAHFHFDEAFSEDQLRIQFSCHWCNMMYDVMLCEMM